ncbi:MAG: VTT domain-containing protein [Deltaproteobacteria bacterium]|nr:VTT domain-containing protein [Deltaproteobacteria bacterium]
MTPVLKLLAIFFVISFVFLLAYAIWGDDFEFLFSFKACKDWFSNIRPWAWAVGILLLISDLVLPVPATGVIAALGAVYGIWTGTVIGLVGSVSAGVVGYATARHAGYRVVRYIASEKELARHRVFFDQWGGYAVIASRMIPLMPEVVSVLAGLFNMKFRRFLAALLVGALPACLLFSWMGHFSREDSGIGILLSVLFPVILWPLILKLMK